MKKVGIFVPEQHGDIALSTSGLKYKASLWPDHAVIWFGHLDNPGKVTYLDMLKHNDLIDEIRPWPKFSTMEHFRSFSVRGKLVMDRIGDFDSTKDLDFGFFPAPWCVMPGFEGTTYPEISRTIYGADRSLSWHPYLGFCQQDHEMARAFIASLPHKKTVILETELRSAGMFQLADDTVRTLMQICRTKWGNVNFVFASKIDHSKYVDDPGVVSGSQFTVRQLALVHDHCDLMIGVCSGITMACSSWGRKPVPRVELCGGPLATSSIANGPLTSVICDGLTVPHQKVALEQAVSAMIQVIL